MAASKISNLPAATSVPSTTRFAVAQGAVTNKVGPQVVETATGVNPNGVVTASAPAFCGSPAGGLYYKPESTGTGNTGWITLIAE